MGVSQHFLPLRNVRHYTYTALDVMNIDKKVKYVISILISFYFHSITFTNVYKGLMRTGESVQRLFSEETGTRWTLHKKITS